MKKEKLKFLVKLNHYVYFTFTILIILVTKFSCTNSQQANQTIQNLFNPNQIIIFNIDDSQSVENISNSYKQKFDQESINYCNFDPYSLANKYIKQASLNQNGNLKADFRMNIFLKGDSFNETSQITGNKFKKRTKHQLEI